MTDTNRESGNEKSVGGLKNFGLKLKEAFSSLLMKTLLGLIITSAIGYIGNELFYNPIIHFELSGKVVLHDYPDKGVPNAKIYVEGERFETSTNEEGNFFGNMKIRKRTGSITVNCEKKGFETEHKTLYVPLEKKPRQETFFVLKPF